MLNIPEIEARAAACEPEPWRGEGDKPDGGDAAFFAHARTDIPALTELVRELAGALQMHRCYFCSWQTSEGHGCSHCKPVRAVLAKVQL